MHITVETAGLLAQVFPALLIAILIEGRFHFTNKTPRWRSGVNLLVRIVAIFSLALATYVCLWAVMNDIESEAVNGIVGLAYFGSFFGMLLMISDVIDRQLEESERRYKSENEDLRSMGNDD